MSQPKQRKLVEPNSEEIISVMTLGSDTKTAPPNLAPSSPAPLTTSRSSLADPQRSFVLPDPPLKKSKTGLASKKKRKHLDVDREEDFEIGSDDEGPRTEPKNWRQVYALIEEARELMVAPVDEVGAESLGDWQDVENGTLEPKHARFRTLLALMLSSQTKDQVTADAMANLRKRFAPLSVASMLHASESDIDECICKVGFHNRKAMYIKRAVQVLNERYDGDVPATLADITELQGVGPKMAFLLMQIAWKKVIGIGVDTHVHRISNRCGEASAPTQVDTVFHLPLPLIHLFSPQRTSPLLLLSNLTFKLVSHLCFERLGWVTSKTPEETRAKLERWLPKEYWGTINKTLVGFGQMKCLPVRPKCEDCPVSELCPSSTVSRSSKKL